MKPSKALLYWFHRCGDTLDAIDELVLGLKQVGRWNTEETGDNPRVRLRCEIAKVIQGFAAPPEDAAPVEGRVMTHLGTLITRLERQCGRLGSPAITNIVEELRTQYHKDLFHMLPPPYRPD